MFSYYLLLLSLPLMHANALSRQLIDRPFLIHSSNVSYFSFKTAATSITARLIPISHIHPPSTAHIDASSSSLQHTPSCQHYQGYLVLNSSASHPIAVTECISGALYAVVHSPTGTYSIEPSLTSGSSDIYVLDRTSLRQWTGLSVDSELSQKCRAQQLPGSIMESSGGKVQTPNSSSSASPTALTEDQRNVLSTACATASTYRLIKVIFINDYYRVQSFGLNVTHERTQALANIVDLYYATSGFSECFRVQLVGQASFTRDEAPYTYRSCNTYNPDANVEGCHFCQNGQCQRTSTSSEEIDSSQLLETFANWKARLQRSDTFLQVFGEYDTVSLLTSRAFDGPTLGLAYIRVLCTDTADVSIIEEKSTIGGLLYSGQVVAHEFGHTLGMHHSGDGGIMAASTSPIGYGTKFSQESISKLHEIATSSSLNCIAPEPYTPYFFPPDTPWDTVKKVDGSRLDFNHSHMISLSSLAILLVLFFSVNV